MTQKKKKVKKTKALADTFVRMGTHRCINIVHPDCEFKLQTIFIRYQENGQLDVQTIDGKGLVKPPNSENKWIVMINRTIDFVKSTGWTTWKTDSVA